MKKLIQIFAILFFVSTLSACMTTYNPVPQGYQGETATIDDTFRTMATSTGRFFYLSKVNGKDVNNAIRATNQATYGQGMVLSPVGFSRKVPAEEMTLTLVAQVHHAAPINYMFNSGTNYIVTGDVSFIPEAGQSYLVKGYLSSDFSSVWLVNSAGEQVSDAVVLKGDPDKSTAVIAKLVKGKVVLPEPPKTQATIKKQVAITTESFDNPLFFLEQGLSAEAIIKKLGEPDHIRYIEKGFFNNKPEIQIFHFTDLGSVQMVKSPADGQFYSKLTYNVNSQEHYQFVDVVNQADGTETQILGKKFYNIGVYKEQYLDALANKLWQNKYTVDGRMLDGVAYYCKIIANAQSMRYQAMLKNLVADKDVPSKLRRHCKAAKKDIDKLKLATVEQFEFM